MQTRSETLPPRSLATALAVGRIADDFRRDLAANPTLKPSDYLDRAPCEARQRLSEELIGEHFAHLYGDIPSPSGALRYRVVAHLGSGRFGSVYKAEDLQLGRCVALKVLAAQDDAEQSFFQREAQLHGSITHANVVHVYDLLKLTKGHQCLVLEYVEGTTLRKYLDLNEGRLRPQEAAGVLRDIAKAVSCLHAGETTARRPLVHRDLKPENVLIKPDGTAMLADFGLACSVADLHTKRVRAGGTPAYLSPEQALAFQPPYEAGAVDSRSDVWALGAILYEVLAGSPPFTSAQSTQEGVVAEITNCILRYEPTLLRDLAPNVPDDLSRLVARCLRKNPDDRLASAREFVLALNRYLDDDDALLPLDFRERLRRLAHANHVPLRWLDDRVDAWSAAASPVDRLLLLEGNWGCGKSTFLASWVQRVGHPRIVAWHFCCSLTPETRSASRFIRSIVGMLNRCLPAYAAELRTGRARLAIEKRQWESDPSGAFHALVVDPLSRVRPLDDSPVFIVVDALDEADLTARVSIPDLIQMLHSTLPTGIRLVVSARRGALSSDVLGGCRVLSLDNTLSLAMQDGAERQPADEMRDSVRRFILQRLREPDLAERLQASRLSERQAADTLVKVSEANFLYVRNALDGLQNDRISFASLATLPPGLSPALEAFFGRQWPTRRDYMAVRPILEVLAVSLKPIPDVLLQDASGLDIQAFADAMGSLSQYITREAATTALSHKAIADWLLETNSIYRVLAKQGHGCIAEACSRAFLRVAQGTATACPYAISHWVEHLIHAEMWERLSDVLRNDVYLRHRRSDVLEDIHKATILLPPDGILHATLSERGRECWRGQMDAFLMAFEEKPPPRTRELMARLSDAFIDAARALCPAARSDWEAISMIDKAQRRDEVRLAALAAVREGGLAKRKRRRKDSSQ